MSNAKKIQFNIIEFKIGQLTKIKLPKMSGRMNTRNTGKYGHDGRFNQRFNQQNNDKKKIIED